MLKRISAAALSILILFSLFAEVGAVFAEPLNASVSIRFIGDEAKRPGFAQSEITVRPGTGGAKSGYYIIYYTDGQKVLPDYDEAAAIKITGASAKGEIGDGKLLPKEAKGIAAFESKTYYLSETPDIKNAIATAAIPAEKRTPDFGALQFSFGVLSDTHMNYQTHDLGAHEKLQASMNFMAQKKMEMVVITGDITGNRGETPDLEEQYEKHRQLISLSGFPADRVYEAIGNHGNTPKDVALFDQYLGGKDEIHPYKGSPYYHILIEGEKRDQLFIFMAQELKASNESSAYDNFSKKQMDWLEALLKRYGETETNIFITIHSPFLDHGAGDIPGGTYRNCIRFEPEFHQSMRLQALLETYTDAIVMSGHSHVSFYEDANYSDLNNSFARTIHVGSNAQPCGYGDSPTLIRGYDGRRYADAGYGSEGYTVEVYEEFILYTGYNFSTGKKIPDACLLLPIKAYGEAQEEESRAPSQGQEEGAPSDPEGIPAPEAPEEQPEAPAAPEAGQAPADKQPSDPQTPEENIKPSGNTVAFEQEQPSGNLWLWIGILAGVLALITAAAVIIIIVCKKK